MELVLRVLTVVSCVTFVIGFLRLALQVLGIALTKLQYLVKGMFKLNLIESSCHVKKS